MPFQFEFLCKGHPVSLNEIDEEMCKDMGIRCFPDQYSWIFCEVRDLGCFPMLQSKNGGVDSEKLEKYLENNPSDHAELIRKYLVEKYHFRAWYTR